MPRIAILTAALFAGAMSAVTPALPQKSADTLRVYWLDQIADVDPYYNSLRTGLIVAHQAWDGLVCRDPNGYGLKPLPKSWKQVDDTTPEFELQTDAKFHNGYPVTSADVVYTMQQVTDPKSGMSAPSNYTWLAGAAAIDEHRVRIKSKSAFPAALQYLAFVTPIYSIAYREKVGRAVYAKQPIGAGPYRITRVDGVNEIDVERFEDYYPESSNGRPAIRNVVIKEVIDASAELTALLGGQADWIWQYNPDQFDNVERMPNLSAMRQESFRILFIDLESTPRNGKPSPLHDVRVGRAIAYALDRQTFATKLIQGGSRVPDAPCYFAQFGCDQVSAVHYHYNPAKAKALLAEAGYPDGFDTELVNGILLTSWTGAVQGYLAVVGIRAKVTTLQTSAAILVSERGDAPLNMGSWGSYSINDVSAFLPYFFTGSADDQAQGKLVKAGFIEGGSVSDTELRKAAYTRAMKRITDQARMIPIATFTTTYGVSKELNFHPWADETPRFYMSSWK